LAKFAPSAQVVGGWMAGWMGMLQLATCNLHVLAHSGKVYHFGFGQFEAHLGAA